MIGNEKKLAAVETLLRANEGQWVSAMELARVGGLLSFRTRVSECRLLFGMTIDNRQPYHPVHGKTSEYRYRAVEHSQ